MKEEIEFNHRFKIFELSVLTQTSFGFFDFSMQGSNSCAFRDYVERSSSAKLACVAK